MQHADYTTLDAVKRQLKIGKPDDDAFLADKIREASRTISHQFNRVFVPYRETKRFDARGEHVSSWKLRLNEDLLEALTVTNGDATVVASSDYVLRPSNQWPKYKLELKSSSSVNWRYTTAWEEAISIDGVWGYHDDYSHAWGDTQENVPVGGWTASTTTFTAADANGLDDRGRQRFEVGMILRVQDEFIRVNALNTASNLVTIVRGQLGTTAASHVEGLDILSLRMAADAELLCNRVVAWLYQRRATVGEVVQLFDGVRMVIPDEINAMFAPFGYLRRTALYAV